MAGRSNDYSDPRPPPAPPQTTGTGIGTGHGSLSRPTTPPGDANDSNLFSSVLKYLRPLESRRKRPRPASVAIASSYRPESSLSTRISDPKPLGKTRTEDIVPSPSNISTAADTDTPRPEFRPQSALRRAAPSIPPTWHIGAKSSLSRSGGFQDDIDRFIREGLTSPTIPPIPPKSIHRDTARVVSTTSPENFGPVDTAISGKASEHAPLPLLHRKKNSSVGSLSSDATAMALNNPSQESLGMESTAGSHLSQSIPTASSMPQQNMGSGPTNLSGLVCNVHRTTGREPHALVGATTTILGDKMYVFGGRVLSKTRPELTSDLYELDLIKRHWTKIEATGDIPPPRYFHSVCALGDTKLVCYGGMSPRASLPAQNNQSVQSPASAQDQSQSEVVVMSDIHIFDVPTNTWKYIQTTNTPQGRYAHCASILPSSATFTSPNAPLSALHHNPSSANPHQGTLGVEIDGTGGAEMVVVGGQDSSNHYIEQISVFNLRNLKWTATSPLGRSCGAYRSVVAPLSGLPVSEIGSGIAGQKQDDVDGQVDGASMLIYSNYNFLDVKLELQVRLPDGRLVEKVMNTQVSPPGLRFPNGGVINGHFVVSGTYLTSSKQEYALWALDLRTLTWGRIDVGGSIFGQGSWNRGVLWNRRSTFVILGHRKRSLVEDYNHRRLNFSHLCFVELEAFGLYDNPRRSAPTSGYVSASAPAIPAPLQPKVAQQQASGGKTFSTAAENLGLMAQAFTELSDMEILTIGGERIPVSSHILARRWGPYFVQLLRESTAVAGDNHFSDTATLRIPGSAANVRNSTITITPSLGKSSSYSQATTLVNQPSTLSEPPKSSSNSSLLPPLNTNKPTPAPPLPNIDVPSAHSLTPTSRPRTLYLPHTFLTVQLLVHYLYTSSLPPIGSQLCTPQILCSLLQLARPYQVDGLLEATVERLHQVLDGRNAAAVFNAAAMAAGGGRGTGFLSGPGGTLDVLNGAAPPSHSHHGHTSSLTSNPSDTDSIALGTSVPDSIASSLPSTTASSSRPGSSRDHRRPANLRINTNVTPTAGFRNRAESVSSAASTATSASTTTSMTFPDPNDDGAGRKVSASATSATSTTDPVGTGSGANMRGRGRREREVWKGEMSSVVGLQKRGLRGLMEGRRMRERERGMTMSSVAGVGMGVGVGVGAAAGGDGTGLNSGV